MDIEALKSAIREVFDEHHLEHHKELQGDDPAPAIPPTYWARIVALHPEFADACDKWKQFSGEDWTHVLCNQPQFADKCPWDEIEGLQWRFILLNCPELLKYCRWDNIQADEWLGILQEEPKFGVYCNSWAFFSPEEWNELLEVQPRFAGKCSIWDEVVKAENSGWSMSKSFDDGSSIVYDIYVLRKIADKTAPDSPNISALREWVTNLGPTAYIPKTISEICK